MKKKFEDNIIVIIYILLVYTVIATSIENLSNPWKRVYMGIAIIGLVSFNEVFSFSSPKNKTVPLILITAAEAIIFMDSLFNFTNTYSIFYFVLMYQLVMNFNELISILYTFSFCILNITSSVISFGTYNPAYILRQCIYSVLYFVFVYAFIKLLKQIINLNNQLEISRNKYSTSNIKLVSANNELLKANEKVEEMAVLKERNNIAREIHDILGHTLTTALVEVEAAKVNIDKNIDIAKEKLDISSQQIRKGLQEVRTSVKALKANNKIDYYKEIINIIENLVLNYDIVIRHDIDDLSCESDVLLRVIYRCLQEGLTNGIRHGEATAFLFKLKYAEDKILFSLEDNGKGSLSISKGFGLSSMEDRVKELEGNIKFYSELGEGFSINIEFKRDKV